ncbi:uridine diphosphate-N-acetylglucosamine-binding protein YvcK [Actinobacillus pleuropneumoniae]|uniref:gluconeogenesis factor YvcK family protein n=1 Tax=Actinobacillus pleuropneumoniae TaxID=715 RepID=UPI001F3F8D04|nr:uridine diphosphate-N-acetylglucosamine-binding protein YvcK [Actinobacillus pleuropneumoniae]UKH24450.1 uridine diphosphate-N-acetylglucosamine-binding protein YvcK [Actinobacillus pleuropneumoniae]
MSEQNQLSRRHPNLTEVKHIVALGGGHGLGRILSSLTFLGERLTGIVTTTDNGGSTGRIRSQHGGIAWGDLRNCLNQIIIKPTVASALFEYRFGGKGELAGHNLGNLILKALENMNIRPLEGINLVRELLHVRAGLIPMSELPVHLAAQLISGETIVGEVSVDALTEIPRNLLLTPQVPATPEAIEAINQAELIILGPGSFLTSIMPPLLIDEIAKAIQSSLANIIFIDNIVQESGPAGSLSLSDRVKWIEKQIGQERLNGVITTPNNNDRLPNHITLLQKMLSDDEVAYRHDRNKLSKAINDIVALLH